MLSKLRPHLVLIAFVTSVLATLAVLVAWPTTTPVAQPAFEIAPATPAPTVTPTPAPTSAPPSAPTIAATPVLSAVPTAAPAKPGSAIRGTRVAVARADEQTTTSMTDDGAMAAPPLALSDAEPIAPSGTAAPTPPAVVGSAVVPHPRTARGAAALSKIQFDLASAGYTISFHPPNFSYLGLTFTQRRHIEVYVRPGLSDTELAYVVAHEIGHAVDHVLNSRHDRARWRAARGMSSNVAWWPSGVGSDLATPAGDFAECFASWATGSASHSAWGSCAGTESLMAELASG